MAGKNPARNYAIEWVGGKRVDVAGIVSAAIVAAAEPTGDPLGDVGDTDLPLIETLPTEELDVGKYLRPAGDGTMTFDDLPSGAVDAMVPTYAATDFVIPNNRQALFTLPIVLDVGAGIVIGSNSALVEVH